MLVHCPVYLSAILSMAAMIGCSHRMLLVQTCACVTFVVCNTIAGIDVEHKFGAAGVSSAAE